MNKIFVSAYACEPGLGSEIGVGWHWVLEMSKHSDLWVLTRESNRHTIEPWIAAHPEYSHIRFIYYDLPQWTRRWKRGMRGVRIYYNLWQWCSNGIVRRTMQENDIGIFHHLTYGNAIWPVSRYGSKQRFIWGPVSAGTSLPADLTRHYTLPSRMKEALQRIVRRLLPYNVGFCRRCKNADVILCKTTDTIACIPTRYRHKCVQMTDVAVELRQVDSSGHSRAADAPIRYLATGTLVGWRGFDVLLEAFALAVGQNKNLLLTIIGDGNDRQRLQHIVDTRNINNYVSMPGQVGIDEYYRYMSECDVVVNPCFREGAVTVSFDSMAFSKPLICFDTGGYTNYFADGYSRVIRGVGSRQEAIDRLCHEMLSLSDPGRARQMGALAHEAGKQFDWHHKGEEIYNALRELEY